MTGGCVLLKDTDSDHMEGSPKVSLAETSDPPPASLDMPDPEPGKMDRQSKASSSLIRILKERRLFRLLWLATVTTILGDFFNWVALMSLVGRLSSSPFAVSAILITETLPCFLFSGLAGVFADRFDRTSIMLVCNMSSVLACLGLVLAKANESLWLVYLAAAVLFVAQSFFIPAKEGLKPSFLAVEELKAANAIDGMSFSVGLCVGASLGGVVAHQFGLYTCFIINALSFVLSSLLLLLILKEVRKEDYKTVPELEAAGLLSSRHGTDGYSVAPQQERPDSDEQEAPTDVVSGGDHQYKDQVGCWQMYKDGLAFMLEHRSLLYLTLSKAGNNLSFGAVEVIAVRMVRDVYPIGGSGSDEDTGMSLGLGLYWAAAGLGCLLGCQFANMLPNQTRPVLTKAMTVGFFFAACGYSLYAWSPAVWVFYSCGVVMWGGDSIVYVLVQTSGQLETTDRIRGRVFAFMFAVRTVMYALGTVLGALLQQRVGLRHAALPFVGLLWTNFFIFWRVYTPHYGSDTSEALTAAAAHGSGFIRLPSKETLVIDSADPTGESLAPAHGFIELSEPEGSRQLDV